MIRNKRADISKAIGLNGSQIVSADNFFDYSDIDFSKTFRVVGRFTDMSVGQIESAILRMGGNIVNSVSEYPDYVIVGPSKVYLLHTENLMMRLILPRKLVLRLCRNVIS